MRTAEPWPPGKVLLRDCALALFAERGPDAVTVRDIAAAAGVSPGLVVHHFGTKERLREEVDAHVGRSLEGIIAAVAAEPDQLTAGPQGLSASFAELMLAHLPPDSKIPAYLRRLLLTGDGVGKALFRRWFELTHELVVRLTEAGLLRPSDDLETRSAFLLANDLALVLLRKHLEDVLGVDPLSAEGVRRWGAEVTAIYLKGIGRIDG